MRYLSYNILMAVIVAGCFGAPLTQTSQEDPEISAGYFDGDMVIDNMRIGVRDETRRWPNRVVYYKFSDEYFANEHREFILRGMGIIEDVSCIRFQEAAEDKHDYVLITGKTDGCYSNVGYLSGEQNLNLAVNALDKGCFMLGKVVHELLHTLGFFHMHGAPNRDDYVIIKEENVQDVALSNFRKHSQDAVDDYGEEYDYGSIMHYGPFIWSKNGQPTIIALKEEGAAQMGQRRGMSKSDINRLNLMYRCPLKMHTGIFVK